MARVKQNTRVLLVVEDDPGLQSQLKWAFEGYSVQLAEDFESAINQIRRFEPAVVTLDLGLPPDPANASEGLKVLEAILEIKPATKVIVVTGNDDRENAVKAIALGAYDFYQKPVDPDILALIVDRAYQLYELERDYKLLTSVHKSEPLSGFVASGEKIVRVCEMLEKVAPTSSTVLLLGESGTGKELLAKAVHNMSPRADKPFIAINCAAIPENLLESELFGYEKGAFTGANKTTPGKIEYADTGTLFLDEMGDLPLPLQAKLLRFLQERVIERVGGRSEIPVDVRVVCATHQNLERLISERLFREDLFYRVSEITLNIPPLRERDGDAVLMALSFLEKYAEEHPKAPKGFSDEALAAINSYEWPGNARELENKIKRSMIMASGNLITPEDLELSEIKINEMPLNLKEVRENAEKEAILRAVSIYDGNLKQVSDALGVSRPTMYDLVKKYRINT